MLYNKNGFKSDVTIVGEGLQHLNLCAQCLWPLRREASLWCQYLLLTCDLSLNSLIQRTWYNKCLLQPAKGTEDIILTGIFKFSTESQLIKIILKDLLVF